MTQNRHNYSMYASWLPGDLRVPLEVTGGFESYRSNPFTTLVGADLGGRVSIGFIQFNAGSGLAIVFQAARALDQTTFDSTFQQAGISPDQAVDNNFVRNTAWNTQPLRDFLVSFMGSDLGIRAQFKAAIDGYLQPALQICQQWGTTSVRGVCMAFDLSVHKGPAAAAKIWQQCNGSLECVASANDGDTRRRRSMILRDSDISDQPFVMGEFMGSAGAPSGASLEPVAYVDDSGQIVYAQPASDDGGSSKVLYVVLAVLGAIVIGVLVWLGIKKKSE